MTQMAEPRTALRALPRRRFASARAIVALMLREMATSYGRSPIGYLWAVLEPVAGIALLTAVFSALVRQPPLGSNFPLFYASGMMPFLMYSDISAKLLQALNFSRSLLAYPSVTHVDALLARLLLSVLTQLLVAYLVISGILLVFDTRTVLDLPQIALGFAMAAVLGFGIGTMNCFLTGFYPGWGRVWAVVNRPLFLISCIFFLFEDIPQPYRDWLWYNPLVHVVGQVRRGFYPYYDATYVSVPYVVGLGLGLGAAGLLLLGRWHRDILNT